MSQRTVRHFLRKMATVLSLLIAVFALFAVFNAVPAAYAHSTSSCIEVAVLPVGCGMNVGDTVVSPGGGYRMTLQNDGNLVERTGSGAYVWSTFSNGYGTQVNYAAYMQGDGNFVIYCSSLSGACKGTIPIYSTYTYCHPGSHLEVQTDGNIVIYDPHHVAVWARTWNQSHHACH